MTLSKLALTTAAASVTAVAAHAQTGQTDAQSGRADTLDVEKLEEVGAPEAGVLSQATVSEGGDLTAPWALHMGGKDRWQIDKTAVGNILAEAEGGTTLNSLDGEYVGEVVSHEGNRDGDHLLYVEVSNEANLAADRIAFKIGSLKVERVGGLQYQSTLEQLREAVAARVAAMAE